MKKIDNIKKLVKGIVDKKTFYQTVADDLGKKANSLQNHWFNGFWSIPTKHEDRVMEIAQETIKRQIAQQQKLVS